VEEVASEETENEVRPINTKRPEFGIFSHLYQNMLEDDENLHGFLE
jgi:hypothetical protein